MANGIQEEPNMPVSLLKVVTTASAAVLVLLPIIYAAVTTSHGDHETLSISLAILSMGATLGWFAGILVSPFEEQGEQEMFKTYTRQLRLSHPATWSRRSNLS